jgi:hypothetical protein
MLVQVKRNTKEYKTIKTIIADHIDNPGRIRSILLYTIKPYHSLKDAVLLNTQKINKIIMYELAYESLTEYFKNNSKKLFRNSELNIYYFKSSANSKWIESPFSFTGQVNKEVKKTVPNELKKVK